MGYLFMRRLALVLIYKLCDSLDFLSVGPNFAIDFTPYLRILFSIFCLFCNISRRCLQLIYLHSLLLIGLVIGLRDVINLGC